MRSSARITLRKFSLLVNPVDDAEGARLAGMDPTLAGIASRLGTDLQTLARLNDLKAPYRIRPGQVLKNPNAPKPARSSRDRVTPPPSAEGGRYLVFSHIVGGGGKAPAIHHHPQRAAKAVAGKARRGALGVADVKKI